MNKRAFALLLAVSVVLGTLSGFAFSPELREFPEPAAAPAALPGMAQPLADTYRISMTCSGHGVAELYAETAGARESVYFLADPDPGYKVSFDNCGYYMDQYEMELHYIGDNVYEIVMPDGDVKLDLEFVEIPTDYHDVTVTVTGCGTAVVDRTSAKNGESLFLQVVADPGYTLSSVRSRSGDNWQQGYYLSRERYELFMADDDLEILVDFKRNGPYSITTCLDTPGGTALLSHKTAYELETVTVTTVPDRGYRTASVGCFFSGVTRAEENVYTFTMPRFNEEVHVSFEAIVYPVFVTTELPMGGAAYPDVEGAVIGQTVTVTCVPEEGYRVARITGVEELTDNGDNTYSFVMTDAPAELSVLFLRENNPFLDVNETHFFHDPVLWAVENGITNGVDDTHFGAYTVCNRAQVVTFLWRAAGSPEPESESSPFTDVPKDSFYDKAVRWAVENGITNGVDDTHFGPYTVCNRAQVVTFLWRAAGSPEPKSESNPFTDVPTGSFYDKAVRWAVENGITNGASATSFNPGGQCLRSQVVTFLYRADQIPEPEPEPLPFPDIT